MTSRKMVMATWMPWTVVSRSWLMSLIITFMLVPAKLQMNYARDSGTSTPRNARADRPAVLASATLHYLHTNRGRPLRRTTTERRGPCRPGRRRGRPDTALVVVSAARDQCAHGPGCEISPVVTTPGR